MRKRKKLIHYTIDFVILYSVLYFAFKMNELPKQYSTFYYIGEYLKNVVKDIIGVGTIRPGAFDFRIGQGMDVLTTLYGYGLGDPINLLTLFVSQNFMEWFYTALIFLRIYLAGAAFLLYLCRMGLKEAKYLLPGALFYTLLITALFSKIGQPLFLSAMIYLPLLLIALERSLEKKKYGYFIAMVGVSFISSFYFALINTILLVVYIIVRALLLRARISLQNILKLIGAYVWGIAISAVILIPVSYAFIMGASPMFGEEAAQDSQNESPIQAMTTIKDSSFYRVEQPYRVSNQSLVLNYNGTSFSYGVVPRIMVSYYENLAMSSLGQPYECNGQDSRTVVNELSSTKYYVTDSKRKGLVPYGYEAATSKKREDGSKDIVYENKYALGIGYTYLKVMRESEYNKLSPLQKQEVLMMCAIIPDDQMTEALVAEGKELKKDQIKFATHDIYSKIGKITGLKIKKNKDGKTSIKVSKKNATLQILYNGEDNSETYLLIKQLQAEKGEDYNNLIVTSGKNTQTILPLYSKSSSLYYEKEYAAVNLGSGKESKKSVVITFPSKGTFTFESLDIYSYPLKKYTAQALSLRDGELQNVSVTGSSISGKTELENAGWMQFSIPYSKGWTAFVDGKEKVLSVSDTMYMGLYLEEGAHKVLLTYKTPYLNVGAIISIAAILALFVAMLLEKKRSK